MTQQSSKWLHNKRAEIKKTSMVKKKGKKCINQTKHERGSGISLNLKKMKMIFKNPEW